MMSNVNPLTKFDLRKTGRHPLTNYAEIRTHERKVEKNGYTEDIFGFHFM